MDILEGRSTPVVDAMGLWLDGQEPVPTLEEFHQRFGQQHRRFGHRARIKDGNVLDDIFLFHERDAFIKAYGFAVPTAEALDAITNHAPVVEIGAGGGSWARLLQNRGVDIIATDPSLEEFPFTVGQWAEVQPLTGEQAVAKWPDRNVFCSWPSLNRIWLRDSARLMQPGRVLLVVRESATADERTWNYVEEAFEFIKLLELPNWGFLNDTFEIWTKRST